MQHKLVMRLKINHKEKWRMITDEMLRKMNFDGPVLSTGTIELSHFLDEWNCKPQCFEAKLKFNSLEIYDMKSHNLLQNNDWNQDGTVDMSLLQFPEEVD